MAAVLAGRAMVAQLNTEENAGLAGRFGIRGIPALVMMRQGRIIDSMEGSRNLAAILAWFNHHFPA